MIKTFVLLLAVTWIVSFIANAYLHKSTYNNHYSKFYSSLTKTSMSSSSITSSTDNINSNVNVKKSNIVTSIQDIIHQYDYFIIDQWGVLHNGKVPYPGVLEALDLLKAHNKILILLSNSSKRKSSSYKGLQRVLGIKDPLTYFIDIVTSGEIGFHILKDKQLYNNIAYNNNNGKH